MLLQHQVDCSKGYMISLKIIKIILPTDFPKNFLHIVVKFGNLIWNSVKSFESAESIHWQMTHTFDLFEIVPMYIGMFYKSSIFQETEYCSYVVSSNIFSNKKGVRLTEIKKDCQRIKILWAYSIDEDRKSETDNLCKLINEIEVEKEEIRHAKNALRGKINKLKEKSKKCKEKIKALLLNFEPLLEHKPRSNNILISPVIISAERKLLASKVKELLHLKIAIQKEYDKIIIQNNI